MMDSQFKEFLTSVTRRLQGTYLEFLALALTMQAASVVISFREQCESWYSLHILCTSEMFAWICWGIKKVHGIRNWMHWLLHHFLCAQKDLLYVPGHPSICPSVSKYLVTALYILNRLNDIHDTWDKYLSHQNHMQIPHFRSTTLRSRSQFMVKYLNHRTLHITQGLSDSIYYLKDLVSPKPLGG